MPSWNIHIAHAERLLSSNRAGNLCIRDANAFLFGNCVPDIYVGFMVPDATYHIDYCLTHEAKVNLIPMPDADSFWDHYLGRRKPASPAGESLALGAWAHLVADRFYNGNFRAFWKARSLPKGEVLRKGKQADFDLYGRSLHVSTCVDVTDELIDAAKSFGGYTILPDDVMRAAAVANEIVRTGGVAKDSGDTYQLLDAEWMTRVFDACDERVNVWLEAWSELLAQGRRCLAVDVREHAGLPAATPDDLDWWVR